MILMIDDEPRNAETYREELRLSGHTVLYHHQVEDALRTLDAQGDALELVILDIMMPPGVYGKEQTQLGLRTGIPLYEDIRARRPDLPVIVLTNVTDPRVPERFRLEKNCWFRQKTRCLPYQLAELVADILSPAPGDRRREG